MIIQYLSSILFLVVLRRSCSFNRDGHQSIKGFTLCPLLVGSLPSTPILSTPHTSLDLEPPTNKASLPSAKLDGWLACVADSVFLCRKRGRVVQALQRCV